jgi:hypothetical protein
MQSSQTIATYAPKRVALVRMAKPTTISITPTICMNVVALKGSIRAANGLTYCSQFVKTFKNLSTPARNANNPRAILDVIQAVFNLLIILWLRCVSRAVPPIEFQKHKRLRSIESSRSILTSIATLEHFGSCLLQNTQIVDTGDCRLSTRLWKSSNECRFLPIFLKLSSRYMPSRFTSNLA